MKARNKEGEYLAQLRREAVCPRLVRLRRGQQLQVARVEIVQVLKHYALTTTTKGKRSYRFLKCFQENTKC